MEKSYIIIYLYFWIGFVVFSYFGSLLESAPILRWGICSPRFPVIVILDSHAEVTVGWLVSWRSAAELIENVFFWLVVWNINFIFPFSWECHHPN